MELNDFSHVKPMPQVNTTRTRRFNPYDWPQPKPLRVIGHLRISKDRNHDFNGCMRHLRDIVQWCDENNMAHRRIRQSRRLPTRPRRFIPPRVYHVLTVNPRSSQHGAQLHTIHDLSVTPASRH